jgi:ankyrin repeat protein
MERNKPKKDWRTKAVPLRAGSVLQCVAMVLLVGPLCLAPQCLATPYLTNDAHVLLDAVKRRDHNAVKALIKARVDVNVAQPDGATALAWAIYLDDAEAAEMLMAAGAKVNTADEYGETPLTLACGTGNVALIKKLVESGADVKVARWDGTTALMLAANSGAAEAVKLLVERGANVNAVETRKGQTALMWAASEGHSAVVEVLIRQGADVKAISKGGFTPLIFAAIKNDAKSVRNLLAAGADPNVKLPDGSSILIAAAAFQSSDAAIALVDGGAEVKVADRRGNTPLHTAAQIGDLELVKKLLDKGADPNARNAKALARTGQGGGGPFRPPAGEISPLHIAARANHLDLVKLLVIAGADPKLKGEDGTTLLMQAAGSANVQVVEYVYSLDSDVKAVTSSGATVMHSAVTGVGGSDQKEICKVIRFLADKGAPLDERNAGGRTPIDIADFLPLDQAVDLLTELIIKSGSKPKTPTKR